MVGAGTAGTAATTVGGFLTAAAGGAVPLEPAAGVGCPAALVVDDEAFLADLAGVAAFAAASDAELADPDDAEVGGADVPACVAAEDTSAVGAGCTAAEDAGADSAAAAAGFTTVAGAPVLGAAVVAVAAFTACWQADDSFAKLLLRHCSAWEPRGTPLQ